MAKALDGTDFGSASQALNRHNKKLQRSGFKAPAPAYGDDGSQDDSSGQEPITDNQDAMECVDKLQQMGYTAEDVAQAFDSLSGDDDQGSAADASTQAAPLQIPGLSS